MSPRSHTPSRAHLAPGRVGPPLDPQGLARYLSLRTLWRADPVLYARQRLGLVPTTQQAALLQAIAPPGAKVSVRAGHGVGKTAATAAAIWWHLECFDHAKIPCTAPTASQLEQILWSELARLRRAADERALALGLPEALVLSRLFDLGQRAITDRGRPREWFAVARTARRDNPDALQGFHAGRPDLGAGPGEAGPAAGQGTKGGAQGEAQGEAHGMAAIDRQIPGLTPGPDRSGSLMFVIEEASGVPDAVFEVAEGALSGPGSRLLMVGNPTRNTGFFARSHQRDRAAYTALHFACADSPLVDPGYRAGLVRKYGPDSNIVRVRADGAFPRQDDDVLIPLDLAEAALDRRACGRGCDRRLGIDVARFGDDRTVFVLRAGPAVLALTVATGRDTMAVAGQAQRLAEAWTAQRLFVDEIGVGAGVVDRLREAGLPVAGVNVAAAAPPPRPGQGTGEERGHLLRDHLWLALRRWLRDDQPGFGDLPRDLAQDLAGELTCLRYGFDGAGRVVVESKDSLKRRGLRSPDLADALALTFYDPPPGGRVATLSW